MQPRMNKRLRLKAVLLGASLVLSVIALEGGLQIYHRLKKGTWFNAGNRAFEVGYTKPVSDRRRYSLRENYHDEKIGLHIDADGFRCNARQNRGEKVLVALGDSVPFGAGVADGDTYPSKLNDLIAQKLPESRLSVLNAGVPSYNIRQSLDRLGMEARKKISGKIILATMQAANDISLLTHYRENWSPEVTWADVRFPAGPVRASTILGQKISDLREKRRKHDFENHQKFSDASLIANLKSVLVEGQVEARRLGIRILLLPIDPFYYQLSHQDKNPKLPGWKDYQNYVKLWGDTIENVNRTLEQAALDSRGTFVFFDSRRIMDSQDRSKAYIDFIHLSPWGAQMIAEHLLSFIIENHLLDI